MTSTSPAKINLHLGVGPLRDDGFHPLVSWMVTVGLVDDLEMIPSSRPGTRLRVVDDRGVARTDLGEASKNLIVRAIDLWRAQHPKFGPPGWDVTLTKRIPVGGGLGGGSGNAATTLRMLDAHAQAMCSAERLAELGAVLGSDVAFFFHAPSAVCTDRGQVVRPTPRPRVSAAVLILPDRGVATPQVYKRFDELGCGRVQSLHEEIDWIGLSKLDDLDLLDRLRNDLEPPAFSVAPWLGELHDLAGRLLGRPVRLSGSGSTLLTLYQGLAEAADAARQFREQTHVRSVAVELCPPRASVAGGK